MRDAAAVIPSMAAVACSAVCGYVLHRMRRKGQDLEAEVAALRVRVAALEMSMQVDAAAEIPRGPPSEHVQPAPLAPGSGPSLVMRDEARPPSEPRPPSDQAPSDQAPSEHLYLGWPRGRRRAGTGSETSDPAGWATEAESDTGAALAERVTVEPAASDQLSMLSRRMEMIERSVMWSNRRRPSSSSGDEPKAAGGKRKQQEKKRGGRPRIEESLEPTHSAGVVATRMQMDGPLASIEEHDANEGDQHEAQTRLSRRWSAPVSARQRVLKSRRRRQTQNRQQARRRGEKEEG